MKRLFFIHEKNRDRIRSIEKSDYFMIIDPEYCSEETGNQSSLQTQSHRLSLKKNTMRFSYNIDLLQRWAFTKYGKKSFAEELINDNYSLWPSVELFMQGDLGQLGYELSYPGITFYIDVITAIINDLKPTSVFLENDRGELNKIIAKVCEREKVQIRYLKLPGAGKGMLNTITNNPFLLKNYIKTRIALRKVIARLFCRKLAPKDILILTNDRLSNNENRTDFYWGPIIKELEKRNVGFKVVEYDRIELWKSLELINKRYILQKYDAQFIGTYYKHNTTENARKIVRFMKKKFRHLDANKCFRDSFEYKGIQFYSLIRKRLKKIFLVYSYYIADVYAITKSIIVKDKPRIVLIDHEKNFYGRGLLTEANQRRIKTFAFEGEVAYGNNTYLTHIPLNEVLDRQSPLWRPISDKKFLWGEYTKEWYEKRNFFPVKNLMIIGAPKYDFLKELGSNDVQEIRKKYGFKKQEKLITVITAEWPRQIEYLTGIAKSLVGRSDYKLIIKMHPIGAPSSKAMIEQIMKKFGVKATIVQYENSSKLIFASDLVIACVSTLVYECILLNKKTIVFGSGEDTEQPYLKEGVIKLFQNENDFRKSIISSMESNAGRLNPEKRSRFIKEHLYSDDGKSSKRAVDEIIKTLVKILNK